MAEAQVETPSGWQKVRAGLLAVAGLCALLSVLLMMLRQAGGGVAFTSDDTYLNLAAAHNLHLHRFLGLGLATSVPATTDTLWQLLLSVGQRLPLAAESGALVIGALMALAALLNSHRMAFYLSNRATAGAAVILVALASSLPMDVMRGHSTTLAMVLVSMMLVRYLEGGPRDRWPLPLGAAWWAGLAALVHIELLIIWVAVALHALLTGPFRRGRGYGVVFPVIRVLSSLLVVGMVLSPALAWNMQTLSVPWPRFPDAPLTLDAWAAGASPDLASASLHGSGGVVGECYRRALAVPLTAAWWPLFFLSLGLGYTVVDAVRDRQRLTGTVGLALLLVPLLYAGLYPYVGWNAAGPVFAALQPAWAALIALGIARSAITLCRVSKQMARRELPWLSPGWATSVLVTILALSGVLRHLADGRSEFAAVAELQPVRAQMMESLGDPLPGEHIASDRVGWLAFSRPSRYTDLRGRVSPVLLAFQTGSGWQTQEAADYLRSQGVNRLVTWDGRYRYAEDGFGLSGGDSFPRVLDVP